MSLIISDEARDDVCNALASQVNGGTLEIFSGPPPASPGNPDAGLLLVTFRFSDRAFADAVDGVALNNAIAAATIQATEIAGHYRAKDSLGDVAFQGTVGEAADEADLTIDPKQLEYGHVLSLERFELHIPRADETAARVTSGTATAQRPGR
jgi:hypothetical protein